MHRVILKMVWTLAAVIMAAPMFAQAEPSWLENTMYDSGKINVVLTVVAVVFVVLVVYLISLDRRLKKMEAHEKNIEK